MSANPSKAVNVLTKGVAAVGALVIEEGASSVTIYGVVQQSLSLTVPIITASTEAAVTVSAATWAISTLHAGDVVIATPTSSSALTPLVLTRAVAQADGSMKVFFANMSDSSSTSTSVAVQFTHIVLNS